MISVQGSTHLLSVRTHLHNQIHLHNQVLCNKCTHLHLLTHDMTKPLPAQWFTRCSVVLNSVWRYLLLQPNRDWLLAVSQRCAMTVRPRAFVLINRLRQKRTALLPLAARNASTLLKPLRASKSVS